MTIVSTSMSADGADERQRVLLIGLGSTTASALEGLVGEFDVVAVVRDVADSTSTRAAELGVAVITDTAVPAVRDAVRTHRPDAVVVSSYHRILDAELISNCPFVNVHYAPLPRGRGRATVNWALINGDDEACISIHHLVADLDAGGILYQGSTPITAASTVATLYDDLNQLQQANIADAVRRAIAGDPGRSQVEDDASYLCTRVPDDGDVDWSAPTATVDRLVRALKDPFPPAFTWLGLDRIEIIDAAPVTDAPRYEGRVPGRVVGVDRRGGSVDVLTADGVFRLHQLRTEQGEPVAASDIVTSVKMTLGLQTSDLVRALAAQRGTTS